MNSGTQSWKAYAALPLRGIVAVYLYLSLKAEVYKPSAIHEFGDHLEKIGLPIPHAMAYIGTYSMLVSYVLLLLGWKARWAAVPMIVYFLVALIWGHLLQGHPLSKMTAALMLLATGIFFLLNGPGRPSVDEGL